jgi:hypothetical protein
VKNKRFTVAALFSAAIVFSAAAVPIPVAYAAPEDEERTPEITAEYRYILGDEPPEIPESITAFGREYILVNTASPALESTLPVTRTYEWRIDGSISAEDIARADGLGNVTLTPVGVKRETRIDKTETIEGLPTNDVEYLPQEQTYEISSAERPEGVTVGAFKLAGAEFELAGYDEYGLPGSYTATCVYRGTETYLETHYWLGESVYTTKEQRPGLESYVIVATYAPANPAPTVADPILEEQEIGDAPVPAGLTVLQKIAIGAGIAVLALAVILILLLMRRRNNVKTV